MVTSSKSSRITDWALRLVPVAILIMAIPPKFTADPGAVALFSQLGSEPFGRIGTGMYESLAVLLLLIPGTVVFGGLLLAGLMSGAILSHLVILGVFLDGDPSMFIMAVVALSSSLALVWRRRCEIPLLNQFVRSCQAPTA
jgi:putative oxidoreductase